MSPEIKKMQQSAVNSRQMTMASQNLQQTTKLRAGQLSRILQSHKSPREAGFHHMRHNKSNFLKQRHSTALQKTAKHKSLQEESSQRDPRTNWTDQNQICSSSATNPGPDSRSQVLAEKVLSEEPDTMVWAGGSSSLFSPVASPPLIEKKALSETINQDEISLKSSEMRNPPLRVSASDLQIPKARVPPRSVINNTPLKGIPKLKQGSAHKLQQKSDL